MKPLNTRKMYNERGYFIVSKPENLAEQIRILQNQAMLIQGVKLVNGKYYEIEYTFLELEYEERLNMDG